MLEHYTPEEVKDTLAMILSQGIDSWKARVERGGLFLAALEAGTTPEEYDALRVEHGCAPMLAVIRRKWLDLPERVAEALAEDSAIGQHLWGGVW